MALTAKQQAFAEHYVKNGNATAAAIYAGYSEKTAGTVGPLLSKHPAIEAFINEAKKSAAERLGITQQWLLDSFRKNYERCAEMVPVLVNGKQKYVKNAEGVEVAVFAQYDPKAAAKFGEMIGKHLKMFTEKVELSNPEGETFRHEPLTAEEAARQYQEMIKATS